MKALIVDGYNVINRVPEFQSRLEKSLEAAREHLIRYCGRWRDTRGDFGELHVVFDGDSEVIGSYNRTVSGVQITYTRTKEDADDRIRQMLDDSPRNRQCVVVTDDNELAAGVRSRGGGLMSAMEFAGVLRAKNHSPRGGKADDFKASLSPEDEKRINADLKKAWGLE
ncbi:MAG: NYN domain-containing protein [bacterium]